MAYPLTMKTWQTFYDDQDGTASDPEGKRAASLAMAESMYTQNVIDAGELAEMVEQAEAAYAWGVEELLATS